MNLGCIADDFTGATDLAALLRRSGASVKLHFGLPILPSDGLSDIEIIALKCRTEALSKAVTDCLKAGSWLLAGGAKKLYWKYCSTFDCTAEGNIGPVAEALMELTKKTKSLYCPAFPENGRSVFMGHLFVGNRLLSESSMKDHPLTPMGDSDLTRVLAPQVKGSVGLWSRIDQKNGEAFPTETHVIGDAVEFNDLKYLASHAPSHVLLTGGSALALALPELVSFASKGFMPCPQTAPRVLILSGSCSLMTQKQVALYKANNPAYQLNPESLSSGALEECIAWLRSQPYDQAPLIYATTTTDQVKKVQEKLGVAAAGALVEKAMAELSRIAFDLGFRRFVIAGGETSGAVTQALNIKEVMIGEEICPGVPWVFGGPNNDPVALALKSGNFGSQSFFQDALDLLESH